MCFRKGNFTEGFFHPNWIGDPGLLGFDSGAYYQGDSTKCLRVIRDIFIQTPPCKVSRLQDQSSPLWRDAISVGAPFHQ